MIPVLPVLAMAAQVGKGLIDNANAKRLDAKANALNAAIPQVDPGVQGQLNDIRLRQQYAEHGQSAMLALKQRMIQNAGAQTQDNIRRASGSAPGGTIQGLLRSQNETQNGLETAGAQSESLAPTYMGLETPLVNDSADRTLSLKTYVRDLTGFRAAQAHQDANNELTGALGLATAFQPTLFGQKSAPVAPTDAPPPLGAQIGNPNFMSSYVDPTLGQEVTGLGNPGAAPQWQ